MGLSGCFTFREDGRFSTLTPRGLYLSLPDDDTDFSLGFRHGCNTSQGILGDGLLRLHGFDYDINRGIENQDYYIGYRTGADACAYHLSSGII